MIDRFLDWQLKIFLILGFISVSIVFLLDFRGFPALFLFLFALALIFTGQKLYSIETSENWLKFSYSETLKNIIGGVLMLIGWGVFLRGVLSLAIAALFLKLS